jgi:hypothetical protein
VRTEGSGGLWAESGRGNTDVSKEIQSRRCFSGLVRLRSFLLPCNPSAIVERSTCVPGTISPRADREGRILATIVYPKLDDLRATALLVMEPDPASIQKPRLLDRVREAVRTRHYSRRTEKAYVAWIKRYILKLVSLCGTL